MSRTMLWFAVLAIGASLYWWYATTYAPPSLTILSPTGGEAWQPGESHTLAWQEHGIPATDKISVTIRRLPPPPLQTEGQEFDPIIFTNVPNTGTTTWTISPMYPSGTYVIGITAYASVPVENPIAAESAPFTLTHPKLSADLAPLYTGADVAWQATEAESFLIGTTTYAGTSASSAVLPAGMDPGAIFMPFMNYYDTLLKSRGWHIANDLAAGGHTGGQVGYRSGANVITVGFHIDYQTKPENAPTECPCDVTLSVFSGQ